MQVKVVRKRTEALDVVCFELAAADGARLPAFSAGAHIDVHVKPGLIRQYSLCNSDVEKHRYVIGVLRDQASRGGSKAMHESVHEGDILTISEPRNHFALDRTAEHSLLIAGGIGVTPILCMAEHLAQTGASFEMHYCARSPEHMAFRNHIQRQPYAAKVMFHFDDGDPSQKLDLERLLSRPDAVSHLYVCGPSGFLEWVLQAAQQAGWSPETLHREYFNGQPIPNSDFAGFKIELARSGRLLDVTEDETVVQALAAQGISLAVSCEQGVCGTCLTRVLSGVPDHRDMFMTDAEHARNDQFTPCCSRSKSPILVLDL